MPDSSAPASVQVAPAVDQSATNTTEPVVAAPFNDAFAALNEFSLLDQPDVSSPGAKDAKRVSDSAKPAKPDKQAKPAKAAEPDRPGMESLEKPVVDPPPAEPPSEAPKVDKPPDTKPKQGPWQMLREAQARLKEYEAKATAKPDDAATTAATDRLAKLEADLAAKERDLQLADYAKSEDYTKNFWQPFADAYTEAKAAVAKFQLTDIQTGETRQATEADFDTLMQIRDPNEAAEMIDSLFGTGAKAAEVAAMRRDIIKLNTVRIRQIENKRLEAESKTVQTEAEHAKAHGEIAKAYTDTLAKLGIDRKEFFAPDDDPKGNEILEKSRAIADLAFGKQPEGKPKLSGVELARLHAVIHSKATGFDRQVYRNQLLRTKLAAVEKELAEYRTSEPGKGDGKAGAPVRTLSLMEAAERDLGTMAT